MSFTVVYSARAISDMDNGYNWYEIQQPGLGDRFIDTIHQTVDALAEHPFAYPSKHKNTRETNIPSFPYVLIYLIEGNLIFIQAVFAARQNPSKKYRRL